MKSFGFTASIQQNSNRVVSSSQADWNSVVAGSFLKFVSDKNFYNIIKSNNIFLNYDFQVTDPRKIKINKDVGVNLFKEDYIKISYKEFELLTVLKVSKSGKEYKQNDIIYLEGGNPSIDSTTNENQAVSLIVTEIDGQGGIANVGLSNKGKYTEPPQSKCNIYGGSGSDAEIEVEFQPTDTKTIIERQILMLNYQPQSSEICLDYNLPNGIKKGTLSCQKWEIYLSANYLGQTRKSEEYEICRNFSPYLKLPLMVKNSFSTEIVYNDAILKLENKIKELEEKIELLNKK